MSDDEPTFEPLTLEEVTNNLGIDVGEDDERLSDLIRTAREQVEDDTGFVLTPRSITETVRAFGSWIDLDSWPIRSIDAIRYPLNGAMSPLDRTAWATSLKRRPVRLLPVTTGWGVPPATSALPIEIDVSAGFLTPAEVPMKLKQAMHLLIAHWYQNREAVISGTAAAAVTLPLGYASLIEKSLLVRV